MPMDDGIHLDYVLIEIVCTTDWTGEADAEFLRIVSQIRHSGLRLHLRDLGDIVFPVTVVAWAVASERIRHMFDQGLMPSSDHDLSIDFDVPPTSAAVSDPDKLVLDLANAARH